MLATNQKLWIIQQKKELDLLDIADFSTQQPILGELTDIQTGKQQKGALPVDMQAIQMGINMETVVHLYNNSVFQRKWSSGTGGRT